jgi:hypothetical protein
VNRYTPLHSFLVEYFGEGFPMSETEQEALNWLAYNDTAMLVPSFPGSDYSDSLNRKLLERYIAVLFYFETGGGNWTRKAGWLSGNNICNGWYGLSCFDWYGTPIDEITAIGLREFLCLICMPFCNIFSPCTKCVSSSHFKLLTTLWVHCQAIWDCCRRYGT